MKLTKLLNTCITILAVSGIIICILAVNRMDYEMCIGSSYALMNTVKSLMRGLSLCIPAVIRRIYGKKFA